MNPSRNPSVQPRLQARPVKAEGCAGAVSKGACSHPAGRQEIAAQPMRTVSTEQQATPAISERPKFSNMLGACLELLALRAL
jgi:hypothetical protein